MSLSVRPNVVSAIGGRIRCRVMAFARANSRSPSAPWIRPNPDSPTPPNGSICRGMLRHRYDSEGLGQALEEERGAQ